jgi:hypothetical protein
MKASRTTSAHPQPTTIEALLAREEARAIQRIADSVQRLGDDVLTATELRSRIRRHPFLATGLGACLGFLGGPLMPSFLRRMSAMASGLTSPASRQPHTLPGIALASLRAVRAHRSRVP